jgi:hypothetical protein
MNSPEVANHFAALDQAFGRFSAMAQGTDATVVVCADHGIIDTSPAHTIILEAHPHLAQTLALPLCGEPRVAYCYVRPKRQSDFEAYVTQELCERCTMMPSEQLVVDGFFGVGTPHPRLTERIGDYALIMHDKYVLKDHLPGETVFAHRGVHGGLSDIERLVPLVVFTT